MTGLKNVRNRRDDALSRIAWDRLEVLLATYYRDLGYAVDHCGTGLTGGRFDGGIDLKLRKGDEYILVQCKHWNAKQVPHNAVHQLLGLMVNEAATGAILVTSGEFTAAAKAAAVKLGHVQLVDGDCLRDMLGPVTEPAPRMPGVFDSISLSAPRGAPEAGRAGDRGPRAEEGRMAPARARGRGHGVVFKVLAAASLLVIAGLALRTVFTTIEGLASSPVLAPATPAARPLSQARAEAPVAEAASEASDPCRGIVAPSGTHIDRCVRAAVDTDAADPRALQRRADEAIEVLEDSTPEM